MYLNLFGRRVKDTSDPSAAIGAAIHVGKSVKRVPIAMVETAKKLTSGSYVELDEIDLSRLSDFGIGVRSMTTSERNAMLPKMLERGMTSEQVQAELGKPLWFAEEPVSVACYFEPAD